MCSVKAKCDSSEEKQVILAFRAQVHHHTGYRFIYLGKIISKHWLLNGPGINTWSYAMWRMASTVWHVNAEHLPQIPSQVVTTRCYKVLCGNYFMVQEAKSYVKPIKGVDMYGPLSSLN